MTFLNVARKQMRAILGVNIYGLMRRKILILKELMKYHKNFSKDLTNHTKSTAISIFDRCKVSSRNRKILNRIDEFLTNFEQS